MRQQDLDAIGKAGTAAWKQIKKTWGHWMIVGEALQAGRTWAMESAKTNRPEGRGYNEQFNQYLTRYKLNEIDKTARSKLLYIMEHRPMFEQFRDTLTAEERHRLNNPVAMVRRWQAATRVTKPKVTVPTMEESEGLRAHILELEAATEASKPLTLGGAREAYLAHLRLLSADQWEAELDALEEQLLAASLAASNVALKRRAH